MRLPHYSVRLERLRLLAMILACTPLDVRLSASQKAEIHGLGDQTNDA